MPAFLSDDDIDEMLGDFREGAAARQAKGAEARHQAMRVKKAERAEAKARLTVIEGGA